ncbi:hypothetical protein H9W95_01010 [Flavobacterium lindanitolerans]|nr:hypothetical protein [Flavobacterium lindanitolerans]
MSFQNGYFNPAKLHKRWFYPVNSKYPAPHISEMRNIIIVNLVFTKKANDSTIINFKVKAPRAFDFGKLFYYFINDYNEKNPNSRSAIWMIKTSLMDGIFTRSRNGSAHPIT